MLEINKLRKEILISMIVSGVVIFLGVIFLAIEPFGGICIIFLGIGAIAFISATLTNSYKKKYKTTIVSEVVTYSHHLR